MKMRQHISQDINKQVKCTVCPDTFPESDYNSIELDKFLLLHRKDSGGLIKPSKVVIEVCMYTEKKIRQVLNITNNLIPTEKFAGDIHYASCFKTKKFLKVWKTIFLIFLLMT